MPSMIKRLFSAPAYRVALLLPLLLASSGVVARAELPPHVYREMQEKAPESLVIKVRSVRTTETDEPSLTRVSVTVEALVQRVNRSRSRLKRGRLIRITYEQERHKEPMVGPSEVPLVMKGQVYPAYLKKSGARTYAPAAGGYTFETVN